MDPSLRGFASDLIFTEEWLKNLNISQRWRTEDIVKWFWHFSMEASPSSLAVLTYTLRVNSCPLSVLAQSGWRSLKGVSFVTCETELIRFTIASSFILISIRRGLGDLVTRPWNAKTIGHVLWAMDSVSNYEIDPSLYMSECVLAFQKYFERLYLSLFLFSRSLLHSLSELWLERAIIYEHLQLFALARPEVDKREYVLGEFKSFASRLAPSK